MQNNTIITLFVGQSLVKLSEIDSTNDYLKELLSNSKPLTEGTVIMADHQFAGRGQQENVWESEAGKNLTISILLNPSFLSLQQQFYLNKAISLGINDCLRSIIGNECKIKWPNDIYYKNQKLGGVLIENIAVGNTIKHSIVGVGINVNQQKFGNRLETATSLCKILHQDCYLNDLLKQLCECIEKRYLQLKANLFELLDDAYAKQLLRLNKKGSYIIDGKTVNATLKGVSPQGYLLLQINDEVKSFDLKQVKFIFE